ncbi:Hsp20/alpha crystallin family protein [Gaoshiqia sediminis]|uniref:Hsp20/alpha crystallin family protein n=1 Tax=Gaoshiqia sediminis TaxID=2986998 RepID=A0AA41YBD8_9BACT|nr:Hsp20/alpha crystallin family protein [Gaoshiqia sediminis]MCW0482905.1 Hsp20/alpha crystallin family protein [Gaoshiqia sediminis]
MKLVKVNPAYSFNAVDRLLNDLFTQEYRSDRFAKNELSWQPATNLFEDEKSVQIELLIPGFEKEQVKISVEKDLLVIKGEVAEQEGQAAKYARVEFKPQNFEKKFRLSEKLDAEKIEAAFKNGILKLVVSKKEEAIPQRREIEIA